ncbi:MAG: hypothetical protein ACI8V2_003859 [Candidatus Latescibacterota bacterium]|jgi:hypothetical protein
MKRNSNKRQCLEAEGWRVGSVKDFLGLSQEELESIDLKLAKFNPSNKKKISGKNNLNDI